MRQPSKGSPKASATAAAKAANVTFAERFMEGKNLWAATAESR
ncbi:MAG TPA: hypothetical protein VFS10_00570 [Pyrinomonadaceae bacterium]|nr:hypothetical protein [Pyrinomonadaceae bacterium]